MVQTKTFKIAFFYCGYQKSFIFRFPITILHQNMENIHIEDVEDSNEINSNLTSLLRVMMVSCVSISQHFRRYNYDGNGDDDDVEYLIRPRIRSIWGSCNVPAATLPN